MDKSRALTVLAIDDVQDNLTALGAVVQDALPGTRFLTALNGPEGLNLASAEDPDVILLDVVMPGMDGFEVCRTLKSRDSLRAIPVLFLTAARTDAQSRSRALESGADGFLSKPLDEIELVAQIRAMAKVKAAGQLRRLDKQALAALVAERTFELEEELGRHRKTEAERESLQAQLLQAQKMESVGRLAGGVAHDFNNMLSVILGHVELALGQVADGTRLQADLVEIQQAARRSADLTRQLLAFARKQTVVRKVLDLDATVEGTLKMLRRLIGEQIDLVWRPGAGSWPVLMDPAQIDQLLANLCVNARDAIGGVGTVTIETGHAQIDAASAAARPGCAPGEYVRLTVSDTGCGMDRPTLEHLFEPFFTTKGVGEGTGLGLATVYGVVSQNHGFIDVESNPGHGSTFRIFLPRLAGASGEAGGSPSPVPLSRGHETILLVEDEPGILALNTRILVNLGYAVLAAGSPEEATRIADAHQGPIDLLMTDVIMPGMNGRDLASALMFQRPNMRCLFVSGYTADVIAVHGVLDEGVHFIQKPYAINVLATKVREVLTDASRLASGTLLHGDGHASVELPRKH